MKYFGHADCSGSGETVVTDQCVVLCSKYEVFYPSVVCWTVGLGQPATPPSLLRPPSPLPTLCPSPVPAYTVPALPPPRHYSSQLLGYLQQLEPVILEQEPGPTDEQTDCIARASHWKPEPLDQTLPAPTHSQNF